MDYARYSRSSMSVDDKYIYRMVFFFPKAAKEKKKNSTFSDLSAWLSSTA